MKDQLFEVLLPRDLVDPETGVSKKHWVVTQVRDLKFNRSLRDLSHSGLVICPRCNRPVMLNLAEDPCHAKHRAQDAATCGRVSVSRPRC